MSQFLVFIFWLALAALTTVNQLGGTFFIFIFWLALAALTAVYQLAGNLLTFLSVFWVELSVLPPLNLSIFFYLYWVQLLESPPAEKGQTFKKQKKFWFGLVFRYCGKKKIKTKKGRNVGIGCSHQRSPAGKELDKKLANEKGRIQKTL